MFTDIDRLKSTLDNNRPLPSHLVKSLAEDLAIDGVHYHGYDKAERDGRKIAHITVMPTDSEKLGETVEKVVGLLPNKLGMA